MNPTLLSYLPYLLSAGVPVIASVLNDPTPNRKWLRVLVVVALTALAGALQAYEAGELSLNTWLKATAMITIGSQSFHRLLGLVLGKIEVSTGKGVGHIIDALLTPRARSTDLDPETLARFQQFEAMLKALQDSQSSQKSGDDSA